MLFNRTLGLDILPSERETQENMVSYQQPLLYLLNLNLDVDDSKLLREAFKNKNDETYGIFHMLVDPPPANIWKILS